MVLRKSGEVERKWTDVLAGLEIPTLEGASSHPSYQHQILSFWTFWMTKIYKKKWFVRKSSP